MSAHSILKTKSQDTALTSNPVGRSQSEPAVPKNDPMTLYTTPPDGMPPIFILLLQLIKDTLAFFIRGGLSTLMFSMDLVLRLIIFVLDTWLQLPGAFVIAYTARFMLWCYQMLMWVMYTTVELAFYLPAPFLVLYLLVLILIYYKMPEELEPVLKSMLWLSQRFLNMLKYFVMSETT